MTMVRQWRSSVCMSGGLGLWKRGLLHFFCKRVGFWLQKSGMLHAGGVMFRGVFCMQGETDSTIDGSHDIS